MTKIFMSKNGFFIVWLEVVYFSNMRKSYFVFIDFIWLDGSLGVACDNVCESVQKRKLHYQFDSLWAYNNLVCMCYLGPRALCKVSSIICISNAIITVISNYKCELIPTLLSTILLRDIDYYDLRMLRFYLIQQNKLWKILQR